MEKKITFIIPSLNRPSIRRTIESLIKQTNPNWKCIIIYDGVKGEKFDDDRIEIIYSTKIGVMGNNHGQSGLVRNIGLKKCNTEWIGFLDDDDTIDEKYVETLFQKYEKYDFIVWRMKYTNGQIIPRINAENLSFGNVGISFCYKNKFNDLFFEKNRDGEDFDFVEKLKSLSNNFIVAPEVYYKVRH